MANDQTEARRERMRALWIFSDRHIAEVLIEEGYSATNPHTAEAKRKQLDAMRKEVSRDRIWWKKRWRAEKNATREDSHETRGEYLANLDAYKGVGVDILSDPHIKSTPRVQALLALARIEEAKAKATGVAEIAPVDPGDGDAPKVPFLGIVVGLSKISPAALKKIKAWNAGNDDKDGDEE